MAEWEDYMIIGSDEKKCSLLNKETDICSNCERSLEKHEISSGSCDECLGFKEK